MSDSPSQAPKSSPARRTQYTLRDVFTPVFIGISLINFLGMVAYYAAFVVSTSFLTQVHHASTSMAGLATGIVVIGCLVGRFFSGRIVELAGCRTVLAAGVILYMASNIGYLADGGLWYYFFIRFISGVAVGVIGTVTGSVVALITPRPLLGRGISYFSMSTALALCFGPFLGIAFLDILGYEGIFLVCAAISAVSVAIALFLSVPNPPARTAARRISIEDFIAPKLIPFCLLIALFCLGWGCAQAFLASYGKAYDVTGAASLFFLFYAAAVLISRPFTGRIYDSHGPAVIFYPAIASLAAGLGLLWTAWGEWSVLAAGVLMGFGFGNIQSLGQSTAVSMVPRERYTQATSTFYIFFDLGIGAAPYLFGLLAGTLSLAQIFGINALIALAGLPIYRLIARYRTQRPASGEAVNLDD